MEEERLLVPIIEKNESRTTSASLRKKMGITLFVSSTQNDQNRTVLQYVSTVGQTYKITGG